MHTGAGWLFPKRVARRCVRRSDYFTIFIPKIDDDMEFLAQYNLTGLVIGVATFLIIGLFHPLVIRGEYRFGVGCWWVFLVMGVAAVAASIAVRHILWSTLLAVWGASSFWSIGELFEQRKRVEKGWFPRNPNRR